MLFFKTASTHFIEPCNGSSFFPDLFAGVRVSTGGNFFIDPLKGGNLTFRLKTRLRDLFAELLFLVLIALWILREVLKSTPKTNPKTVHKQIPFLLNLILITRRWRNKERFAKTVIGLGSHNMFVPTLLKLISPLTRGKPWGAYPRRGRLESTFMSRPLNVKTLNPKPDVVRDVDLVMLSYIDSLLRGGTHPPVNETITFPSGTHVRITQK